MTYDICGMWCDIANNRNSNSHRFQQTIATGLWRQTLIICLAVEMGRRPPMSELKPPTRYIISHQSSFLRSLSPCSVMFEDVFGGAYLDPLVIYQLP